MMLRELNEVLTELQSCVAPLAQARQAGVRLSTVELNVPLDMVVVLRGGGCVLLADVPRNSEDVRWFDEMGSQLKVQLVAEALQ
jgi:hypothetical protein